MRAAILAAILAGAITSAQAFGGHTTVCRSYSDGVFSFIECGWHLHRPRPWRGEKSLPHPQCLFPALSKTTAAAGV